MAYQCQTCGQKFKQASRSGSCVACDSFEVKRIGQKAASSQVLDSKKTKTELAIMLTLWSLLLYGVWDKYLAHYVLSNA